MKTRVGLLVLLIMTAVCVAGAQRRMPSTEDQVKQLKEQLKLNDEQTKEVTKILTEQRKKATKLRESGEMGPDMRNAFLKISEETDKKMMKVLTEDQQVAYKKLMDERRQARSRRRSG